MAFIIPAKTHPDVVVAAVAARDQKKAEAYAKKHGIPVVHKSYQGIRRSFIPRYSTSLVVFDSKSHS